MPGSARADDLLANIYDFAAHEPVQLPENPDWSENPFENNNWLYQYHTLRWSRSLVVKWQETSDSAYLDRFRFLLLDWYEDNPRDSAPSKFSWDAHSTAYRAMAYACASEFLSEAWVEDALVLHGETLADPEFYVNRGNHAFNQSIGLLAIGCRLGNESWIDIASARIQDLVSDSLDRQGVINEQAVGYQVYNRNIYVGAKDWFAACGLVEPRSLSRVADMDDFLAHATMPNGDYVMIGDTERRPAKAYSSSLSQFTASGGEHGSRPDSTSVLYEAGFFFTRSGWGQDREFIDEVFASVRFGPARTLHGHHDGGSITLYGYGTPLLIDPGKFTYNPGSLRDFFRGPTGHNIVLVEGVPYLERETTELQQIHRTDGYDFLTLERSIADGVDWSREVLFSRDGYLIVVDRIDQAESGTVQQLWHLVEESEPVLSGASVVTNRNFGNIAIVQLVQPDHISIVEGSEDPVQGWISYDFGVREPAPTVVSSSTGNDVTFVTLLAPSQVGEIPEVLAVDVTEDAVKVDFVFLGTENRVRISGGAVSLEVVP